jgi:hypothetical protein
MEIWGRDRKGKERIRIRGGGGRRRRRVLTDGEDVENPQRR